MVLIAFRCQKGNGGENLRLKIRCRLLVIYQIIPQKFTLLDLLKLLPNGSEKTLLQFSLSVFSS